MLRRRGNMIAVSVIVPVYNAENYLEKCIKSVLEQTINNFEVVCINDGSSDQSLNILKKFRSCDARVKVIDKKNTGAAHSRNVGMQAAEGEYLFFLDSDDWIPSKDVLELLYDYAKSNHLDVCGGSLCIFESGKCVTNFNDSQKKYVFDTDQVIDYRDYQFDLGFSRFIYKREMLLQNDIRFPQYKNYEDPVFCVKALNAAGKIGTLKKMVYVYRKNMESASHVVNLSSAIDMVCGMKANLEFAEKNELYDLYRTTYRRLNKESLCELENCLNYYDPEHQLFKLLIQVDANINHEILGDDKNNMLESINMVYQEYRKYETFRNHKLIKVLYALIKRKR